MKQFAIHEANIERLRKHMTRIRNKCQKYGCEFLYEEVDEEFREVKAQDGETYIARFILVNVEGKAIINDWRFVGSITHINTGNIVRCVTEMDVPEKYYHTECECEHCKSRRHRKETYLVYNEKTNEFKQVGSSCLCDFTGGLDAELMANYISYFDKLMEFEAAPASSGSSGHYYNLEDVLIYAADFVKHIGYTSSGSFDVSTKERVIDCLLVDSGRGGKYAEESVREYRETYHPDYKDEKLLEFVGSAIEYAKNLEPDGNYLHNIQNIAKAGYVEHKDMGYAVSIIPTYNRYLGKIEAAKAYEARKALLNEKQAQEALESQYVGEVGDKIEIKNPEVSIITAWDTQWGTTFRWKIVSESNVYMWDTSALCVNLDAQKVVSIKATVKKHDEFRGVKQTWITRGRAEVVNTVSVGEDDHKPASDDVDKAMTEFMEAVS